MKLIGKKALVTGAGNGIGRAIALAFAEAGADVAVLDINYEAAVSTSVAVKAYGVSSLAVSADVSSESQIRDAFQNVINVFSTLDILVNNAGIESSSLVKDMPEAMWDRMIQVNLKSVFLCSRAALQIMLPRKTGRIINISSQLAHKGAKELAHYAAAKAGVIGFTRSLAYEIATEGLTVNAICPGPVDTELFRSLPEAFRTAKIAELPIGRPAQPEEIAPVAVMLASDAGAYFLGSTLNPNGGDYMI